MEILLGIFLIILAALSRIYVRRRLREAGVNLKTWVSPGDELRYTHEYLRMAHSHHFPRLPAILAIAGLPAAFLLMLFGAMLHR